MRVIVMGSSTFALPALKNIQKYHEIIAVYTREAKPSGRGMKLKQTPIGEYAQTHNLPIFTPKNFKNAWAIDEFKNLKADIAVVAAYGLILPQEILESPKYGCLNIHGSLLPRWRGAAPIHHALISGDSKTGVSIMQMSQGLDEGDVFATQDIPLKDSDNTGIIHDLLAQMGADLLIDVMEKLPDAIKAIPQDPYNMTYAHKISKQECLLNFEYYTAREIILKINGLNPFPTAFFYYQNHRIKIYEANIIDHHRLPAQKAGYIDSDLNIYCKQGVIRPTFLQKENKQKQHISDFLNGVKSNQVSHK